MIAKPFVTLADYVQKGLGFSGLALVQVDYAVGACTEAEAVEYTKVAQDAAMAAVLGNVVKQS